MLQILQEQTEMLAELKTLQCFTLELQPISYRTQRHLVLHHGLLFYVLQFKPGSRVALRRFMTPFRVSIRWIRTCGVAKLACKLFSTTPASGLLTESVRLRSKSLMPECITSGKETESNAGIVMEDCRTGSGMTILWRSSPNGFLFVSLSSNRKAPTMSTKWCWGPPNCDGRTYRILHRDRQRRESPTRCDPTPSKQNPSWWSPSIQVGPFCSVKLWLRKSNAPFVLRGKPIFSATKSQWVSFSILFVKSFWRHDNICLSKS